MDRSHDGVYIRHTYCSRSYYYNDAFYDRGSAFPLKCLLIDGVQNRQNADLVSKNDSFVNLGPWDYSSGCNLIFAEVNVWVRYGAPQVRILRKIRVNLYIRTPLITPLGVKDGDQINASLMLGLSIMHEQRERPAVGVAVGVGSCHVRDVRLLAFNHCTADTNHCFRSFPNRADAVAVIIVPFS